jgi:hypothetical protein
MSTSAAEATKKRGRQTKDEASGLLNQFQDQLIKAIGTQPISI